MPLPAPMPRNLLTRRSIVTEGYLREDGMMEIEGHLVDVRGYDVFNEWRGLVTSGTPAHDIWVRLTVDASLIIVAATASMDATPHRTCSEIQRSVEKLAGLSIASGFKKQARARIGGTAGCTHILALIEAMAPVAVHALAGKRRGEGHGAALDTYVPRRDGSHPLIGSCHSYRPGSPIVRMLWPDYRPPEHDAE